MSSRLATVLGALLVGAVVGSAATWFATGGPSVAPPVPALAPLVQGERTAAPEPAETTQRTGVPVPTPAGTGGTPVPAAREDAAWYSPALQAYARAEIERGWREHRQDPCPGEVMALALAQFEEAVRTEPFDLGQRAAKERSEAEVKAALFEHSDDGVALLAAIEGDEPPAAPFVQSERFAALFAPRGGGGTVDGSRLEAGAAVATGSVIAFPAGVFRLADLASASDPYPSDLTVRGVGMDATLLFAETQRAREAMQRLAIEDCTVFSDSLLDLRSAPAVLQLTRMRLIGFDCGAGGCVALDTRELALRAIDCRFESGYGRSPGLYAHVLRSRQARLLRFERCVFDRVSVGEGDVPTAFFLDCVLHEMLEPQPPKAIWRRCRYEEIAAEHRWDADYRRRDLNALFPGWEGALQGR